MNHGDKPYYVYYRYDFWTGWGCDLRGLPDAVVTNMRSNEKIAEMSSHVVKHKMEMNKRYNMRISVPVAEYSNYVHFDAWDGAILDHRGLRRIPASQLVSNGNYENNKIYTGASFISDDLSYWGKDEYFQHRMAISRWHGERGKIYTSNYGTVLRSELDGSLRYYSNIGCHSNSRQSDKVCPNPPIDKGYIKVYNNGRAFAGLRADGSIATWGFQWASQAPADGIDCGVTGGPGPDDKGYISILSAGCSFTAIKADGTMYTWGTFYGFEDGETLPTNINKGID